MFIFIQRYFFSLKNPPLTNGLANAIYWYFLIKYNIARRVCCVPFLCHIQDRRIQHLINKKEGGEKRERVWKVAVHMVRMKAMDLGMCSKRSG